MFGWKLIRESEYIELLHDRDKALRANAMSAIFSALDPSLDHILNYIVYKGYPVHRVERVRKDLVRKKAEGVKDDG